MSVTKHEVKITKRLDRSTGKWIVRISGITSGFEVDGGDGDNMAIRFHLDASRFEPVIKVGN